MVLRKNNTGSSVLRQKVASCVEAFAPLPSVSMRVLSMIVDSETTTTDLEEVLKGDISLVTSVLKLANSAFYGVRREVTSLRHALLLLGKSEVQSLVLSKVMFQAFKVPVGAQKDMMVAVWRHSLECGLAAESIAEQIDEENPVLFLGGMLHDLGKLVIIQKFLPEFYGFDSYAESSEEDKLEIEHKVLGCGHDELGAMLLHRWMFPEEIEKMLRRHHSYSHISNRSRPCQVLILANLLSRWVAAEDFPKQKGGQDGRVGDLHELLLRCGEDSKIIPSAESLEQVGRFYRKNLEEKSDLLAMLSM